MSDEEFEKFEITDYDLDNEFNVHRPRRKLSKNQQIYGIWAEDSDEEVKPTRKVKGSADFTAPIGFVSAGINVTKSEKPQIVSEDNEEDSQTKLEPDSSSESDDGQVLQHAGFGHSSHKKNSDAFEEMAGFRRPEAVTNLKSKNLMTQRGLGKWEKHTKGIGAKLLLKMGYEPGKGLGKDLQGISAPVEAHLRKGRGALGAYGPEKHSKIAKLTDEPDSEPESKSNKSQLKRKSNKRTIVTVDDLLSKSRLSDRYLNYDDDSEITKVKVVDMTGPEKRIYNGYQSISETNKVAAISSCNVSNEFLRRIRMLIVENERKVVDCDRLLRELQTRYKNDKEDLLDMENKLDDHKNSMKCVLKIDEIRDLENESIGTLIDKVKDLLDNCHNFDTIERYFKSICLKKLTSKLADWNMFQDPGRYFYDFERLRHLLSEHIGVFNYLFIRVIVTRVKNELWSWDMRDCEPVIGFLEKWKLLIPKKPYEQIIDNFVLTRLKTSVNNWNPQMDLVPLHTWLHPWFLILGTERMEDEIFPIIDYKMSAALLEWHPSDQSAKLLLKPWTNALRKGTLESFLIKNILPKLESVFQMFQINPSQQNLEIWQWVFDWTDMIPAVVMSQLLEQFFLPKWMQTLLMWLSNNPNYNQVSDWYLGWKKLVPDPIMAQTNIKHSFDQAFEMINRTSTVCMPPPSFRPNITPDIPIHSTLPPQSIPIVTPPPPPPPPRISTNNDQNQLIPITFKERVMRCCEERGVLFVPIPNRFYEAKQVYKVGATMQCYIDRNVLFFSTNGLNWVPTSLNRLLDIA